MTILKTVLLTMLITCAVVQVMAQSRSTMGDCIAENSDGWPLPWSGMKYSLSSRTPFSNGENSTELHKQMLIFEKKIAIPVPSCTGNNLFQTNNIARLDFQGHVFAYLVSGVRVSRDGNGRLLDMGSVAFAMWYDDRGDGRFRKVIGTPELPPAIPSWARTSTPAKR